MLVEQMVGPRPAADGSDIPLRATRDGAQAVQDAHARYMESVYRGNVFIGATLGGTPVTTQAGLSATTPALTLYNPATSNKLAVLIDCTVGLNAAPAAACFFMLANNVATAAAPTATTDATIQNALTNDLSTSTIKCYRIATLAAAPVAIRFGVGVTGASALSPSQIFGEIDGKIIVGPGVALSIQTSSAAAIVASMTWEEIPA